MDSDEGEVDLFQEPADFYQPEKQATFASHKLLSGTELNIRLVGHNPLWVRGLLTKDVRDIELPSSSLFRSPLYHSLLSGGSFHGPSKRH